MAFEHKKQQGVEKEYFSRAISRVSLASKIRERNRGSIVEQMFSNKSTPKKLNISQHNFLQVNKRNSKMRRKSSRVSHSKKTSSKNGSNPVV
jgi:hypothetical protein